MISIKTTIIRNKQNVINSLEIGIDVNPKYKTETKLLVNCGYKFVREYSSPGFRAKSDYKVRMLYSKGKLNCHIEYLNSLMRILRYYKN
jgi:hypothetical protein